MADHRFHFFRAGGVDQVSLRDGHDLRALKDLDNKLWVALAMPTTGVDVEPETLALLDTDKDGRIRKDDIVAAIDWAIATFKEPGDILKSSGSLKLASIADAKIVASAKRMLGDLGKPDATSIAVEDMAAIATAFANTALNGDGIITTVATTDGELQNVITDIVAAHGSVVDRSGKPGCDTAIVTAFFTEIDQQAAWYAAENKPLGDATGAATDALDAIAAKLDDYFTRCKVAAFDPRGEASLGGADTELAALSTRSLSAGDDELAKLPLAHVTPAARLALDKLNPAWAARVLAFVELCVKPIVGVRDVLVPADLAAVIEKLAPVQAWRAAKPANKIGAIDAKRIAVLADPAIRERITKLIADDAALSPEYDAISLVAKAVRFQRDFGRVLRNFANFSDFYARQDGIFQAGTLYLDARALHLAIPVLDAAKHAALAAGSDAYLAYVDCTRLGEKMQVVIAVTNGDSENIFVGRNGVFYDRKGQDWDATINKVIGNPISIREAFFAPYKKLVKVIEDNVTKRASAAETKSMGAVEETGAGIAHADAVAVPAPTKKIDLGTVAAIGVAIGGIGTLIGAVFGGLFGLGLWLPLGILAVILMISTPSMLLAWLKLRRRNLGPILDANGWAVNSRARINVAFGAALTELAKLPPNAQRSLDDPFADKKTPWKRWVFLIVLLVLAGTWFVGKLDRWLPERIRSTEVLGDSAPASKKAEAEKPAPTAGSGMNAGSGSAAK